MTLTEAAGKIAEFIGRMNQKDIGQLCVQNIQSSINQFDLCLITEGNIEFNIRIRYTFDVLELERFEDYWEELDDFSLMRYLFIEAHARMVRGWFF